MSITPDNTIIITTTMPKTDVARRRQTRLTDTLCNLGFPLLFLRGHGPNGEPKTRKEAIDDMVYRQFLVMKDRMEAFLKVTGYEYGILCDDDYHPHPQFLDEINRTVTLLPTGWRTLHLCPGYLWGRGVFRVSGNTPKGDLTPERSVAGLDINPCQRYYWNCGSGAWSAKHVWLGGPIAVLVKQQYAQQWYEEYCRYFMRENNPNDVILTRILTNHDYVCRQPQLGWEDEQGESCFLAQLPAT